MSKVFYVIQNKTNGEFIFTNSGQTTTIISHAAQWSDIESAQMTIAASVGELKYRVMEVHEVIEYNVVEPKDELQQILDKLSDDEIKILQKSGLNISKSSYDPYLSVTAKYLDHSSVKVLGDFTINAGIILHIMKDKLDVEEQLYPEISDCIIGNEKFREVVSETYIWKDAEGDICMRHPDCHWDYWNWPTSEREIVLMFSELLEQYEDQWGVYRPED